MFFFSWLRNSSAPRNRSRKGTLAGCRRPFVPRLTALEDRTLPSTFLVTNLADAGPGSLRYAVQQANLAPGADAIEFAGGLKGTVALAGGQLSITDDLTINAPGQGRITVSGINANRVFQVAAGVN